MQHHAGLVDLLSTSQQLHPESKAKDLLAAQCPKSLPRFGGGSILMEASSTSSRSTESVSDSSPGSVSDSSQESVSNS